MEGPGLIEWCRRRKAELGFSNEKIADLSNTPKGTKDRILSGSYENFRYSTIRPMLQALVGNEWGKYPCAADVDLVDVEAMQRKIDSLSAELDSVEERAEARISRTLEDKRRTVEHLKEQIEEHRQIEKSKDKSIRILACLFGIAALILISLLILDVTIPHSGWLRWQ